MSKTIIIASGKGGTGKTLCSINLSLALNYLNHKVLLIDGNYRKPNLSLHFNMPHSKTMHDIEKFHPKQMISIHPSGLSLVFGSTDIDKIDNITHQTYSNIIREFKKLQNHDYIFIDTPPNFSKEFFNSVNLADETIVVTTPSQVDLHDTKKTIQLCEDEGSTVTGVLLNIFGYKEQIGLKQIEKKLKRPILGIVPHEKKVKKSIEMKHPILCSYPNSKMSKAFMDIGTKFSYLNS